MNQNLELCENSPNSSIIQLQNVSNQITPATNIEPTDAAPIFDSKYSRAKWLKDNGKIQHDLVNGYFVVITEENKKYMVTLYPEQCSCKAETNCSHLLAVKLSIGRWF